jgi:hypothetical protein
LPSSTYEVKEVVCPNSLEVHKIHACPNDCVLYHGEVNEKLEVCPVYKASRYKIRRADTLDAESEPYRQRILAKIMWYFPIISRLKHLFHNKEHTKMMRSHKEERKVDAM